LETLSFRKCFLNKHIVPVEKFSTQFCDTHRQCRFCW